MKLLYGVWLKNYKSLCMTSIIIAVIEGSARIKHCQSSTFYNMPF